MTSTAPPHSVRLDSPAKLNLTLYVTGRRPDGFHALHSVFARLELCDRLDFVRLNLPDAPCLAPLGDADLPIRLSCSHPALPTDRRNLIVKAAAALLNRAGREALRPSVAIKVDKKIPLGGGLGGGSSNAAATLVALNRIWALGLPGDVLAELAATIGSDVPFFLGSPQALVTGRGEYLAPLAPWPFHAVLVCPPFGCDTAAVYKAFAAGQRDPLPEPLLAGADFWLPGGRPVPPTQLAPRLVNMLYRPACAVQPALPDLAADVARLAGRPAHLSGSGSTLFVLADGAADAAGCAERLAPLTPRGCQVVATSARSA